MNTLLIIVVAALILSIVLVYAGVSIFNKEAKEKETSEKSYTVWSVVSGFFIGFFVILYEIVMDMFIRRRKRY